MEGDHAVTLSAEAVDTLRDCLRRIEDADRWAAGADLTYDEAMTNGETIVAERREQVTRMEGSLLRSLIGLLTGRQDHDGPLRVNGDAAPLSFFWSHAGGYHGGLIFHPNANESRVGTWSVHT